jgi:imidazole glycerol-phosphate synthase subunit HisH
VSPRIAVLDYGMGNLHSVGRALARVGADVCVTSDHAEAVGASGLVIPGVGGFGACVRSLREAGFEPVVRTAVAGDRPVFGVCVGMQILFAGSDEDPDEGLAILPGHVGRLPSTVRVPHTGWNTVAWTGRRHAYTAGIPDGTSFYFVHSYAPAVDPELTVGVADHGRSFAAAVARDNVFATQFHPEKSGEAGLELYERFVGEVRAA